jgi:hypothetical protein
MVWGIAARLGMQKGWTLPEFNGIDVDGLYIFFTNELASFSSKNNIVENQHLAALHGFRMRAGTVYACKSAQS